WCHVYLHSNFKHEHILRLLGVCLDNDPNFIILELMEGGDLLSYVRVERPTQVHKSKMCIKDLVHICVDVAKGCKYLEEMHFVHRDLAARNCLVSTKDPATRVVKIGDFGLARDIYRNDYYRKEGEGLLPVRWMSPESLVDGVFTNQSDMWAFGVLLWEVMTLGQQPYPARNNLEVLNFVRGGGKLDPPQNCPDEM
ncbi:PREDICTED: proto-oncogene tyrosine-protein kinase ROS-like, partial [Priapulus caudatus]|uniref:receptor protein-tyrosine kinase n=1 Tax=Priapulus caudatus TaxID=37621 RepID=A0ABM1F3S7_PRICU